MIIDAVFAGIWMSLGWSLRGQFGHLHGALIPGAFAALFLALSSGERGKQAFPLAVILGSVGFSLGGHFSYGKIIEAVQQAPHLSSAAGNLWKVFMIGSIWGGLGSTLLGFGFSEKPFSKKDAALLGPLFLFWFVLLGVFNLERYDLAAFGGGLVLLQIYNLTVKKSVIIARLGLAGFLGFGLGFLIAVLLLPWCPLRDQILGFIGGLFLYLSLPKVTVTFSGGRHWLSRLGFLWLLLFIPAVNIRDVLVYWTSAGRFPSWGLYVLAGHLAFLFFVLVLGIMKIKPAGFLDRRIFLFSALYLIWFLSFWATAKEMFVFGPARWETAYSLFFFFSILISARLFLKKENP